MHNFLMAWNNHQTPELRANPEFLSGYYASPLTWRPGHANPADFPHPTLPVDRLAVDLQTIPHCNITNPTEFYHWVRMQRLGVGQIPNLRVVCHDHNLGPRVIIYTPESALLPLRQSPKYEAWLRRTSMLLPQAKVADPMDHLSWVRNRLPTRGVRYPHPHHVHLVNQGLRDHVTHFVRAQRSCREQIADTPYDMTDYTPTTDGEDLPQFAVEDILVG